MEFCRLNRFLLYFFISIISFSCENKGDTKIIYYCEKNSYTHKEFTKVLIWNFKEGYISKNNRIISFNYDMDGKILLSKDKKKISYYDFSSNKTYDFGIQEDNNFYSPSTIKFKDSIKVKYNNKNYFIYKFHCNEYVRDGDSYHYFLKDWGMILYQIYGSKKYSDWVPFDAKHSHLKIEEIIGIIENLKNKQFLLGNTMLPNPKVPEIKKLE